MEVEEINWRVRRRVLEIFPHPIPKPFTKDGKKDVLEVVPYIEVVNHLDICFCQELRGGHVNFTDLYL